MIRIERSLWRWVSASAAAVFVALPGQARAQAATSLDSATAAAIAPVIAEAQAARLPLDLLYAKAREGQVQRVPTARIQSAVRALAARIRTANDALAPSPSDQELRAGVDAIKAGVPVETLRAMRREVGDGSLAVPIGVLTSLVARGVPVERASVEVVDLLHRGALPRNFIALEQSVRQDVLAGWRPDESMELRLKAIILNLPQPATSAAELQATTPKRPR